MVDMIGERCPGCGSVVVPAGANRAGCHALSVDPTQPGYAYLKGVWGYCFHLSRNVMVDDETWLETYVRTHTPVA